jgi:hypothetical protein
MAEFVIFYNSSGTPQDPEEGAKGREEFQAWLSDLGDAVVNPGTPLGAPLTVSNEGVSQKSRPDRLTGFSVVKAANMDAAVDMAKRCPFLKMGTIDVAEAFEM